MANKRALNLLDSIGPSDSSESDDGDYIDPEARPAKKTRQATDTTSNALSDTIDPEKLKEAEEKAKVDKRRKGEEEWSTLMRLEDEARAARSSAGPSSSTLGARETLEGRGVKVVQVRRPRNFAGEVIYEIVSLPADHPDVKRYGAHITPADDNTGGGVAAEATTNTPAVTPSNSTSTTNTSRSTSRPSPVTPTSTSTHTSTTGPTCPLPSTTTMPMPTSSTSRPAPPKRRKPRQSLESMNAELVRQAGIKKMSTFEKSQLDWASLTSTSTSLSTELEANRRTGGFLEKQDFLGRVGERKDDKLSQGSGGRRRAG